MKVFISPGNDKLGKIPNFSFPPIISCNPDAPCIQKGCYAVKILRYSRTATAAWLRNWALWQQDGELLMGEIYLWLKQNHPKRFRWFVAGDIPSPRFLSSMCTLARGFPKTKFLCFTKQHHFFNGGEEIPKNLQIIFSAWPGWVSNLAPNMSKRFRIAWMQDGTETRVPKDAKMCGGSCESCSSCFLPGPDVVFHQH